MALEVVILAAGQGTRMRSALPKVLHQLGGRSLLGRVIDTARELRPEAIHVVVGHQADQVRDSIDGEDLNWVLQAEQRGTGHALQQVAPALGARSRVLVLYGDVPLVRAESLRPLVDDASDLALMTVVLPDPSGYGRILRSVDGRVTGNVEHRDADPSQLAIHEVNTGILCARASRLLRWLEQLLPDNAQGELYLTDVIRLAAEDGVEVTTAHPALVEEVEGVNDRVQLARLERAWQRRAAEQLMRAGVTVRDPQRLDIRGQVVAGMDSVLDVNVVLEGRCELGQRVSVGPNCVIRDSVIGNDVVIEAHSVVDGAVIGDRATVGPFARIRPGTELGPASRVGNFVETKAVRLGEGSKANHLTYLGDATIGRDVNIGAGTITCNYDGAAKHQTTIADEAFIGSNTSLVAPVSIGAGATVGAGSAITRDVAPGQLAVARGQQRNVDGWKRPRKKKD